MTAESPWSACNTGSRSQHLYSAASRDTTGGTAGQRPTASASLRMVPIRRTALDAMFRVAENCQPRVAAASSTSRWAGERQNELSIVGTTCSTINTSSRSDARSLRRYAKAQLAFDGGASDHRLPPPAAPLGITSARAHRGAARQGRRRHHMASAARIRVLLVEDYDDAREYCSSTHVAAEMVMPERRSDPPGPERHRCGHGFVSAGNDG